jgi:hypothetical protein
MSTLTAQGLAERLTGREYRSEISEDEEREAAVARLVVIFGASDDLVELRGAIDDEVGAYDGTTLRITPDAELLGDWEDVDQNDEDAAEAYFRRKLAGTREITALWAAEDAYSWTFATEIPHATFEVVEDGEPYCRGIVFAVADLEGV